MKRALVLPALLVLAVIALHLRLEPARAAQPASPAISCHVPRLRGLTVQAAKARAAKAGCRLRFRGARVRQATIQTIGRQHPRRGRRARLVTVTVNPLCFGAGLPGPPSGEPLTTPGPTELVSGIYLEGGPLVLFSRPRCARAPGQPSAGTITVFRPNGGGLVATVQVRRGQLARIPLAPGSYVITGELAGQGRTEPLAVTIPAGETVRQDLVIPVP